MAIEILQQPEQNLFSQSPIVCSISESNAEIYTSSSMQFVAEFKYWQGDETSGSVTPVKYTLQKFPNPSGSAIFDFSRIASSLFTTPRAAETSSVYWGDAEFYAQYQTSPSSSFFTGSKASSNSFAIFDGYQIFQQGIQTSGSLEGQIISSSAFWPIMTDGPTSQSYFEDNFGRMSLWRGIQESTAKRPSALIYSSSNASENNNYVFNFTQSVVSGEMVTTFPISPLEPDWPLSSNPDDIGNFEIFAVDGPKNYDGTNRISDVLHFDLECTKRYPNVRIKWKNRFGQWDYFNFNLVSRETFNTQRSKYQPQIGTWGSRTLTYNDYDSAIQNYITDSTLKISVNTDYVNQDYNEIFKQLMVSDEIYWVYEEGSELNNTEKLKPLAIDTSAFALKTGVVDKLIQYQFTFTQGQGYKLIF
jgi:hypothetical protein